MPLDGAGEWSSVGERIRLARRTAGLSVRELARRVDMSASHVSQVERGMASFSVPMLYTVVSELGISMDSLFLEPGATGRSYPADVDSDSELDRAGIVLRGRDRPTIQLKSGPRWERLTPLPESDSEFLEVVYAPRAHGTDVPDFIRHDGREYGVVVSGRLQVQVGFETSELGPGDSITFDSRTPHRFWNDGDDEVHAVWFVRDGITPKD